MYNQRMRHTIRGLIIIDKKVLLVTGHGADFYWTPGGGVKADESHERTLRREILEELGVRIVGIVPYATYDYEDQRVENFLIEVDGEMRPSNEITGITWYSSGSKLKTSGGFKEMALPCLLRDGLID